MDRPNTHRMKAFPLQLVLIVPFALQIFGAVGLVGYLSFKNGQKAVNNLANQLMDRTNTMVDQHLDAYLSIPQKVNQINAEAVKMGLLNVRDRQTVSKFFWKQMQAYDLSYIGFGLTTGEGAGASRYDGKTITIDDWTAKPPKNWHTYATDNQGNRTKVLDKIDWNNFQEPWYTEPIKAGKPIWSRIVTINYKYPYIAASAARPIYDQQNQLLGMIAADIHLLKLSEFLRSLDVSHVGRVFILERDGMLIANSSKQEPFTLKNNQIQRIKATESPDITIQNIAKQIQKKFNGFESITEPKKLQLKFQQETNFVYVTPWRDQYGLDWLVVVSVPERAFMDRIITNTQITVLFCFGALILAIVIGYFTSRWLIQPILRINRASQAMAFGNLEQTVRMSSIEELNTLAQSFNYMAEQLRQSFAALEASKAELEDRVSERTNELKTTLIELQRTQAQVIQNEKMSSLGQLVAGVAHEINNPVNFIHGNIVHLSEYVENMVKMLDIYQKRYPDDQEIQAFAEEVDLEFVIEDLQKILPSMKMGTQRIRNIVLSLRNFSRMDESEFKTVDIHEGIESTLLILQHRLKDKPDSPGVEVVRDFSNLPLVECFPGQLNQVLMNILVNAIDALEESIIKSQDSTGQNPDLLIEPQITIRTSVIDTQWVEIAIADNGPGMPEQVKNRVFDPFFTTKPVGKGTGMGMAISYQIITERHNGKLICVSTPGQGTEFKIQIPVKQ
ncbi:ATP-binding protein [Nostoc sp. FACHB-110]|uniref:ATP-binding protein n=1 Tax=Nostoc sp. FACHB-110 TaxID=2692834 RepID=UPI0016888814|nr:ATP-binding protein [Nostoc sp. FACHB-110]MBD2439721.1 HAMP domain-containing protein [Nostoc sp. FACHB-110]